MPDDFRRELELSAPIDAVYDAIATPAGLRAWWTRACDDGGDGLLTARFGSTFKVLRVDALARPRRVEWACVDAYLDAPTLARRDEWRGTTIRFTLDPLGPSRTRLRMEHVGLVPAIECYEMCASGWDQFLESLKRFVETGVGSPFGDAGEGDLGR
jgi:uncharacterized protein YndB with AHSA1/START domain